MRKLKYIFILALTLLIVPAVYPIEGSDQYPNGAENWFAGVTPPTGFYYVNYFGYFAGQLKDASGGKAILGGGTLSVEATFDAFRFVEMTKFRILGADYGVHVTIPVVDQSMNLNGGKATVLDIPGIHQL